MALTPSTTTTFLLLVVLVVLLPTGAHAFGAGDIPDFAYLNDKAFRHGDIENILENLVKNVGGAGAAIGSGGLLGFAKNIIKQASGGSKFSKSDIKKVYFGNWLRDYSQAMDIGGLSKLTADTLVLVVSVLGFMTFGFATEEFQVTADRLGVYLPVEHIDNPKGYAEAEGDARKFHPKLRPPVEQRELEIDERTGMKKYMATENEGFDTSTAFIRRTFRACIEHGRRAQGHEGAELWEAYRLLGTGLHTMEDLLAHSNWCEVALRKMGHEEVFCHVGDDVTINTPNGRAPPLVTGTFGGADFLHSLIGEAGDKLSQASVTDLSQKMSAAATGEAENSNVSALKSILSKLPIGGSSDKMNQGEEIHAEAKAYQFNPDNIAPPEVQQRLMELLKWRDSVMRDILSKIEMVPGLANLIEELTNALNAYVYTVLAPYLGPILTQATGALDEGSKAVINNEDQYEVFDNPRASDPSHSLLSKDHFGLILNEPAGKIAQIVVEHSVTLIVQAWADNSDPDQVITKILEAFHHPYYATGRSQIQHQMFEHMEQWLGGLGPDEASQVIKALTKESVRAHKNKRIGSDDQSWDEPGYGGCSHGGGGSSYKPQGQTQSSNKYSGGGKTQSSNQYSSGGESGYNTQQSNQYSSGGGSGYNTQPSNQHSSGGGSGYNTQPSNQYSSGGGSGHKTQSSSQYSSGGAGGYGSQSQSQYGSRTETSSYGQDNTYSSSNTYDSSNTYGEEPKKAYGGESKKTYGGSSYEESEQPSYGRNAYGQSESRKTHGGESREEGHGRRHHEEDVNQYGGGGRTYGAQHSGKKSHGRKDDEDESFGSGDGGHGRQEQRDEDYGGLSGLQEQPSAYGQSGGRRGGEDEYSSSGFGGRHGREEEPSGYQQPAEPRFGGGRHGRGEEEEFGSSGYGGRAGGNQFTVPPEEPSYGRRGDDGEERHSSRHHHQSQGYTPSYGQSEEQSYGGGGYGGQERSAYGDSGSGYGQQQSSGYAPSYGGGGDTFGAERLNINDDEDEGRGHHGRHGRKHHEEEY